MANFILRHTPPFWSDFIAKAKREGWPVGALVQQLAKDYLDGKIAPSAQAPVELKVVIMPTVCKNCERTFEVRVKHALGFSYFTSKHIHCPFCNYLHDLPILGELVSVGAPDDEA